MLWGLTPLFPPHTPQGKAPSEDEAEGSDEDAQPKGGKVRGVGQGSPRGLGRLRGGEGELNPTAILCLRTCPLQNKFTALRDDDDDDEDEAEEPRKGGEPVSPLG